MLRDPLCFIAKSHRELGLHNTLTAITNSPARLYLRLVDLKRVLAADAMAVDATEGVPEGIPNFIIDSEVVRLQVSAAVGWAHD